MEQTLDVYLHQHLVGNLIQNRYGEVVFTYQEAWVENSYAIPLSHSLPLRKETYKYRDCQGFFEGLLPEEDNRKTLAALFGISAKNDFALLEQIGWECAGSVTLLPAGMPLSEQVRDYKPITEQELGAYLRDLPSRPLLAGKEEMRLSLAGTQNKMAIAIDMGELYLPQGISPSTHILKPDSSRYNGLVFNESFCMRLARVLGLPTAKTETRRCEGIDYLLIERYDRFRSGERTVHRLHQEDFCQALGISSDKKYQKEGGPTLQKCFQLVQEVSHSPALERLTLLDGVIFNFIIGNNDAHGKNFSLLYEGATGAKTSLAPFYDLVSTSYYSQLSENMAMKIGDEQILNKVVPRHFEQFAEKAGLNGRLVLQRVRNLTRATLANLPRVVTEQAVEVQVARLIDKRCTHISQWFTS